MWNIYEGLFLCWRLQLGDRLLSVIQADGISRGQLLVRCVSRQLCLRDMWNDVFKLRLWTKTHVTSSSDQDQERPAYMFVSRHLRQQRNSQFNTVSAEVPPISTISLCLFLLNNTEITEILAWYPVFIAFWYALKVSFIFEKVLVWSISYKNFIDFSNRISCEQLKENFQLWATSYP